MAATTRKGLLGKAGVPCCVRVESGSGTEPRKELDPDGTAKAERFLWPVNSGWRKSGKRRCACPRKVRVVKQEKDEALGSWQTRLTPNAADAANGDFA